MQAMTAELEQVPEQAKACATTSEKEAIPESAPSPSAHHTVTFLVVSTTAVWARSVDKSETTTNPEFGPVQSFKGLNTNGSVNISLYGNTLTTQGVSPRVVFVFPSTVRRALIRLLLGILPSHVVVTALV